MFKRTASYAQQNLSATFSMTNKRIEYKGKHVRASRIIITNPADIYKRDRWNQYAEWFVNIADTMAEAIKKYIP